MLTEEGRYADSLLDEIGRFMLAAVVLEDGRHVFALAPAVVLRPEYWLPGVPAVAVPGAGIVRVGARVAVGVPVPGTAGIPVRDVDALATPDDGALFARRTRALPRRHIDA
ncbi:MAG: hypothetical protein QN174_07765 [Armatimonadota bacterium]|nr:hypothetical protein [Armatimonadota bacterium]